MRNALKMMMFVLALVWAPDAAWAANCTANPYTLTNGSTADANQVMSNFNNLLNCSNTNLAHNGANSDITSLSALSTPLSVAQGGTGATTSTGTGAVVLQTSPSIAGPTVTGHPTVEGVTSTGATGTGKFVFDTAPTIQSLTVPGNITLTGSVQSGLSGTGAASNSFINVLSIGTAGAANNQSYHVTAWVQGTTVTASCDVILSASVANLSGYSNSGGGLTMNNNGGSGSLLINYTGTGTIQYTILRLG